MTVVEKIKMSSEKWNIRFTEADKITQLYGLCTQTIYEFMTMTVTYETLSR